jgi:hypothetical protein
MKNGGKAMPCAIMGASTSVEAGNGRSLQYSPRDP